MTVTDSRPGDISTASKTGTAAPVPAPARRACRCASAMAIPSRST